MKRKSLAAKGAKLVMSIALVASFMIPNAAWASVSTAQDVAPTHGTLEIASAKASDNVITVAKGGSVTVSVTPYQHVQYTGCTKAGCPNDCGDLVEDCFTPGKGCKCMGVAGVLRTATVSATSANTAIATTSEVTGVGDELTASEETVGATRKGELTISGVAAGTTTVTVAATDLRDWQDASVTYTVKVTDPAISSTSMMLHQQFATGTSSVALSNASQAWADAVTGITVAKVTDGVAGEAKALTAEQYTFNTTRGYLYFNRTLADPIFTVDEFNKDPYIARVWGKTKTFPQSQKYVITVKAAGYDDVTAEVVCYTGGCDTFSVIIDADGDASTTDDQTVAKTWTQAEIDAMSTFANGSSQCGMTGFRTFASKGVSLNYLLADAGVTVSDKDHFLVDTTDKYGNEFSYEELFGTTRYFLESAYTDSEVQAAALAASQISDTDSAEYKAAEIQLRRLLASKAKAANTTVEPRISSYYDEIMIEAKDLAGASVPTESTSTFSDLIRTENQYRFTYGLSLVQEDCTVTFNSNGGSEVASQTVKSHLMTSTQNTTIKSSYWVNALVIYRNGAGEAPAASTAADALTEPAAPTRAGYEFGGWYTDEACTTAFDFAANDGTVDANTTLYAKWTKNAAGNDDPNTPAVTPAVTTTDNVTLNKATVTAKMIKAAAKNGATTITLGAKVKKISKNAFKGTKITKIVIKSKKLKKSKVKNALKGSKVKTVQVKVGSKKLNKKYVKKYKKIFTKKNCGKKVKVK